MAGGEYVVINQYLWLLKGMNLNTRQKISLGSALASISGAGVALSAIFGWVSLARPWGFLLGLLCGIAAGVGVALVISGLSEHKRSNLS